jgi:hypothetical protein
MMFDDVRELFKICVLIQSWLKPLESCWNLFEHVSNVDRDAVRTCYEKCEKYLMLPSAPAMRRTYHHARSMRLISDKSTRTSIVSTYRVYVDRGIVFVERHWSPNCSITLNLIVPLMVGILGNDSENFKFKQLFEAEIQMVMHHHQYMLSSPATFPLNVSNLPSVLIFCLLQHCRQCVWGLTCPICAAALLCQCADAILDWIHVTVSDRWGLSCEYLTCQIRILLLLTSTAEDSMNIWYFINGVSRVWW